MKKVITLFITAAMIISMLCSVIYAAEITSESKLISVAYSEKLNLYVTVANDGQTYTSGDGLNWGPGAKLTPSTDLGAIIGNSYYVTPTAVIWNPDLEEFVLAAGNKLYRSNDGFSWGSAITPRAGSNTLVIHTLFWDGEKYWAATTSGGQVVYAKDNTLTSWTSKTLASGTKPIDGFAKADSGRLFACTTVNNAKTLYYTDDGVTWTDGTVKNTAPYRTTSIAYSKKLEKIILAGGNGSNAASNGDAAIGRADVTTGATETKLQLKADTNNASPQIPVISDFVVHDTYNNETNTITKEEIISVSYTGAINYRLVEDANDLTTNRKWKEVLPASGETANTAGLIDVIHGKDGYVAVGGDPSNSDRGSATAGMTAIFIPDDYTQGYQIGKFDDLESQTPTTLYISGEDEIEIPLSGFKTEEYSVTVRDQGGNAIENASNTILWSIDGGPKTGISVASGVVTVTSEAEAQEIVVTAYDSVDSSIKGSKKILISDAPFPTTIQISGSSSLIKSENETRTSAYTASVLDQLGRAVPNEDDMEKVVWSLGYPETNAASGLSINAVTGVLSVPAEADVGDVNIVATSAYEGASSLSATYSVHISAIASVTASGPANYYHYFGQCTNSACTYTFTPKVYDSDGEVISEECEYSIAEDYYNPNVSISKAANGDCVLTLRKNIVSDTLNLLIKVKNAPEVTGLCQLNIVDTMVPNGKLFEKENGSIVPLNWTKVGDIAPSSLGTNENHGRWIFNLNSADADQYMSFQSDAFEVKAGGVYKFGFRSQGVKIANHDDSYTPLLYMMVTFLDSNSDMTGEPVLIYDTLVSEGRAHATSADFYEILTIPQGAVSAQVTMTATPPLEFNLFDIGCYPLVDSGEIEIKGDYSVEAGDEITMRAETTGLLYDDRSIPLPNGIKWFLKNAYSGVSIDIDTGVLTVSDSAEAGEVTVVAVVSGNTTIRDEKTVTVTKTVKELTASNIRIETETITAGSTVNASASLVNTTDAAEYVNIIVAVYSSNGSLAYIAVAEAEEIPNDGAAHTVTASCNIPSGANTNGLFAKAFVWKSMLGIVPVKQN